MEKKFKIGIWNYPEGSFADGGAFSYASKMQRVLTNSEFDGIELVSIGFDPIDPNIKGDKIHLKPLYKHFFLRILTSILLRLPFLKKLHLSITARYEKRLMDQLTAAGIELIYYVKPGVNFPEFPHIATIWDNGHISSYPFPEVCANGNLEGRLNNFIIALNKAMLICCESEAGKQELIDFYPINPNRLVVVPMMASEVVEKHIEADPVNELQGLQFFFYPAKYWPHKNHYNLIKAFAIFAKKYPAIKLVFTGFHQNNPKYINQCISDNGLNDKVIQLGVVSLEKLKWLYQHAIAMVMPTFIGPTNMPLMEAYYLNCKVICSDLKGHQEQLGAYAHYFNPLAIEEIAAKLEECYLEPPLKQAKAPTEEISLENLQQIFNKAKAIRRTWA